MSAYLALHRGQRVLAIDLDPQGQLGKVLGIDVSTTRRSAVELLVDTLLDDESLDRPTPEVNAPVDSNSPLPIVHTRIPDLDLVVANKSLALFPTWGGDAGGDPTGRLSRTLRRSKTVNNYHYVFFDAPPSFGPLTLSLLRACDEVVIPVPLTYLALDGCAELNRTIAMVRSRYAHRDLRISMVVPTFYRRTKLAHEVLERLKQRFPKEIAHTVVGFHVKIDEAQARGLSIFEYAAKDRGARAMAALAEELEARVPPWRGDEV